jgi:hypothetical protein
MAGEATTVRIDNPSYQAYQVLHIAFTVAPIVAGADKFFHFLTNWDLYLAPIVTNTLQIGAHTFMLGVGIVEMIAGLIVAVAPRIGGWVVGFWLCGIIVNLLILGSYFDIALRDLGLALGAFALARLSVDYSEI